MLKRVDAYELRCDGCGELFESADYVIWLDSGAAVDEAEGYDWDTYRVDEKHFCPDCAIDHPAPAPVSRGVVT